MPEPMSPGEVSILRQADHSWRTDALMARLFATLDQAQAERDEWRAKYAALLRKVALYSNDPALADEASRCYSKLTGSFSSLERR